MATARAAGSLPSSRHYTTTVRLSLRVRRVERREGAGKRATANGKIFLIHGGTRRDTEGHGEGQGNGGWQLSERGFGGIPGMWGMGCCLDDDMGVSGGENCRGTAGRDARKVLAFLIGGGLWRGGAWAPTRGAPTGGDRKKMNTMGRPVGGGVGMRRWAVVSEGAMPAGRVHVARGVRRSSLDDLVLALPRPLDRRVGGWRRVVGLGRRRGARRAGRGGAADTWHGYQVDGRGLGEAPELQGLGPKGQGLGRRVGMALCGALNFAHCGQWRKMGEPSSCNRAGGPSNFEATK